MDSRTIKPSESFIAHLDNGKQILVRPQQTLGAGADGSVEMVDVFFQGLAGSMPMAMKTIGTDAVTDLDTINRMGRGEMLVAQFCESPFLRSCWKAFVRGPTYYLYPHVGRRTLRSIVDTLATALQDASSQEKIALLTPWISIAATILLRAIKVIHGRDFCHLDVKIDNIFVSLKCMDNMDTLFQLGDHGALLELGSGIFLKLTSPRGTYPFAPTEMMYENVASKFADIHAFGVTIWALFCCHIPTIEDIQSVQNIGRMHMAFQLPFAWQSERSRAMQIFSALPLEWSELITKCLQLNPTQRGTVDEIFASFPAVFHPATAKSDADLLALFEKTFQTVLEEVGRRAGKKTFEPWSQQFSQRSNVPMSVEEVQQMDHLRFRPINEDDQEPHVPADVDMADEKPTEDADKQPLPQTLESSEPPQKPRRSLQRMVSDHLKRWGVPEPEHLTISACDSERTRNVLTLSSEQILNEIRSKLRIPQESPFWTEWAQMGQLVYQNLREQVEQSENAKKVSVSILVPRSGGKGKVGIALRSQTLAFCVVLFRAKLLLCKPNTNIFNEEDDE
eukprot:TRINITY_DN211_c0_g1_i1.p1 TRINITY_DN211_c0_g1~~TRINITY_DN211_c0_g1_i1.p1  ORF type:complete len:563 (+),score=70.43 TRINITY_DN211_c0_g1_i1:4308-5996(+)